MEGRLLRCEEWSGSDRAVKDASEGDGLHRSLYFGRRPPLLGNGAKQDAMLLGNLRDARHNVAVKRNGGHGGVELLCCFTFLLTVCSSHFSVPLSIQL